MGSIHGFDGLSDVISLAVVWILVWEPDVDAFSLDHYLLTLLDV
jgi:hypothetical protein